MTDRRAFASKRCIGDVRQDSSLNSSHAKIQPKSLASDMWHVPINVDKKKSLCYENSFSFEYSLFEYVHLLRICCARRNAADYSFWRRVSPRQTSSIRM